MFSRQKDGGNGIGRRPAVGWDIIQHTGIPSKLINYAESVSFAKKREGRRIHTKINYTRTPAISTKSFSPSYIG